MEATVRTVYGNYLQNALFSKTPFEMYQFTTLNEVWGIQALVPPNTGEIPGFGYYCIGNGGHKVAAGTDGMPLFDPIQHETTDAGLYKPIPLVLREETNDLTSVERANYALRRAEQHNGRRYYAYYLRRIDKTNTRPIMEKVTVSGDVTDTDQFVPTSANLNPVQPTINPSGTNTVDGTYYQVSQRFNLSLSAWEVAEIKNVAMVLFNDIRYAIISEVGLVTGIDRVVPSPSTGSSTIPQNEVICAQIAAHVSALYPLAFSSQGVDIMVDLGTSEPGWELVPSSS